MCTSICYDTDLPLTCYLFFSFWFSLYVVRCYTRAYIYLQVRPLAFLLFALPAFHSISSPLYYQLYLDPDKRNLLLSHSTVEVRPEFRKALSSTHSSTNRVYFGLSSHYLSVSGDSPVLPHTSSYNGSYYSPYFSAPFQLTISSCRTFQSHERVRSSGLRCT